MNVLQTIKVGMKIGEKWVVQNAPDVLTGVSAGLSILAVGLAIPATTKAQKLIYQKEEDGRALAKVREQEYVEMTKFDKIRSCWTCYIPTMMALGTSIAASVFANHISSTRLAALATAYGITEKKVSEYEEAIKSLNEPNQQKVNDKVIDNFVKENPPDGGVIEDTGTGSILFIDKETGRRFKASYSHVANAFKRISDNLVTNEEMHINDLYIELELPEQESGNLLGWFPNDWPINPNFIEKTTETGEKYYVITYNWSVLRDFRGY